jgi:DNA-binding beta-propeller fold protein YncE
MATVGSGQFTYDVDKEWGRRSGSVQTLGLVSGVACDSADRVYLFIRLPVSKVMVFERDGRLLSQWGEGRFAESHGIWISPRDEVYLTDSGSHLVTKWTADGTLLQSWGTLNQPGAPGAPFNRPTRAVVSPDGEMYVSDGYGQFRVHRFGADGHLRVSWGEEGSGPGQFTLPHDVWVDPRDRVVVCDREQNHRVQFFDRDGRYLSEWPERRMPMQVFVRDDVLYLAEGQQRITIMTLDGEVLEQWGSQGPGPDQFTDSPHSIWVDAHGDIYVSEVVAENKLQKYTRH